ncbi:class I SAM-dependent methyltransferase, partial [Candidatus Pelagibacter sp.]|nr:class I SAM-dependent methyltransferase [Candidatus Pelagibacter sp.]
MKQVQYSGFELDHFDSAINFRYYQLSLFKIYLKDNFLEVGAGKGGLAMIYKKLLKNITLIEPDKILFKVLKKKIKGKNISIKNKSIKNINKKFNTIIYFDVLEHIKNDLLEVKTAARKLKPGGYLIFSVPAYQIFYSNFDKS